MPETMKKKIKEKYMPFFSPTDFNSQINNSVLNEEMRVSFDTRPIINMDFFLQICVGNSRMEADETDNILSSSCVQL